jgi:serine/threonine-protein kinase
MASPAAPQIVDGKYRIEQLLGRGGTGAVYRARDVPGDRLVALKIVGAELFGDPETRRQFQREAAIIGRLRHPAIVAVYDVGTLADGSAYLVMELVHGEDLRHLLQREGRLDLQRALPILTTVCAAIEAAHREGILHRDLKPENILLPGGDVEAKVLDFGVATVIDALHAPIADAATIATAAGMIVGTPAYMAPEQLRAGPTDARTDVFSLGVIAFEMLTGDLPFGRSSLADIVLAHARAVPHMTDVAAPLARAIRSALEAEPDRRPASPQAFAHLISAAAAM